MIEIRYIQNIKKRQTRRSLSLFVAEKAENEVTGKERSERI